jgi:predicted ATPase with chaperone activity
MEAAERQRFWAHGYRRVLRVARMLARRSRRLHIAEALSYRRLALGGDLLAR